MRIESGPSIPNRSGRRPAVPDPVKTGFLRAHRVSPRPPIPVFAAVLSFLALAAFFAEEPAGIVFSHSSWEIGPIGRGTVVTLSLGLSNRDGAAHRVTLISTCGCLTVEPVSVLIPPGGTVTVTLTLDSALESGGFEKLLIVRSTHPALSKAAFAVRGTAVEPGTPGAPGGGAITSSPD